MPANLLAMLEQHSQVCLTHCFAVGCAFADWYGRVMQAVSKGLIRVGAPVPKENKAAQQHLFFRFVRRRKPTPPSIGSNTESRNRPAGPGNLALRGTPKLRPSRIDALAHISSLDPAPAPSRQLGVMHRISPKSLLGYSLEELIPGLPAEVA